MTARKSSGLLAACVVTIIATCWVAQVPAQAPAANITGVNPTTGVVTAKIAATGQEFQFVLADRALLRTVRVGQGVFVNLGKKQVSLDGKQPQGTITTLVPLGKTPVAGAGGSGSAGSTTSGGSTGSGTASPPAPVVASCGGTSNPLTADTCGKTPSVATSSGYVASCGATATITGNSYPAGSSDWLTFTVPVPRATCSNPVIQVVISSNQNQIVFDVLTSPIAGPVWNSYTRSSTTGATGAGLGGTGGPGTTDAPLQPGTYYIRVHAVNGTTVGTWTIRITG